jgi:hypothetical protein
LGVEAIAGSVRQILSGKLNPGRFDFVYAAGLFDYLNPSAAIALARRMFEMTSPGGMMLIPNFLVGARDRGYMESFMDWRLIYRDHADMQAMADALPATEVADCRVFDDPDDTITFLLVTKQQAGRRDDPVSSEFLPSGEQRRHGHDRHDVGAKRACAEGDEAAGLAPVWTSSGVQPPSGPTMIIASGDGLESSCPSGSASRDAPGSTSISTVAVSVRGASFGASVSKVIGSRTGRALLPCRTAWPTRSRCVPIARAAARAPAWRR